MGTRRLVPPTIWLATTRAEEDGMPTYVLLVDWTEHGVQAVEHTVERLEEGRKLGESFGCKLEHIWWTQGSHNM
jgi:uncharacterized protein with GYD domain